jgi:hypothetical protein
MYVYSRRVLPDVPYGTGHTKLTLVNMPMATLWYIGLAYTCDINIFWATFL